MTKIGTKLVCTKCNSEFIVTKVGTPTLKCCGEDVQPK